MSDRETLLTAVLMDPADDTTRLVLADLLRESDDPELEARGRFLWAGVTAAQFREHEVIDDPLYYEAQREITAAASSGLPARWLAELGPAFHFADSASWMWDNTLDRVTVRIGSWVGVYARGMLAELSVSLDEWSSIAAVALSRWPVDQVSFADVPGLTFRIEQAGITSRVWRLTGRLRVPARRVPMAGEGIIPAVVSPFAFLVEEATAWQVEERFEDRGALVTGIAEGFARLVMELRDIAGDRWPRKAG